MVSQMFPRILMARAANPLMYLLPRRRQPMPPKHICVSIVVGQCCVWCEHVFCHAACTHRVASGQCWTKFRLDSATISRALLSAVAVELSIDRMLARGWVRSLVHGPAGIINARGVDGIGAYGTSGEIWCVIRKRERVRVHCALPLERLFKSRSSLQAPRCSVQP